MNENERDRTGSRKVRYHRAHESHYSCTAFPVSAHPTPQMIHITHPVTFLAARHCQKKSHAVQPVPTIRSVEDSSIVCVCVCDPVWRPLRLGVTFRRSQRNTWRTWEPEHTWWRPTPASSRKGPWPTGFPKAHQSMTLNKSTSRQICLRNKR